jgi:BsuBI/PstI restriction endonuclease domain/BsuBI/PstI restriction endonuclease HTH domain
MSLPPLPDLAVITARLPQIFPEGTDQRNYLVRGIAARTIFVMFYVGAVEGTGRWLRPNQVTRMTDEQALATGEAERADWTERSLRPQKESIPGRWFADNTREPIRDETIKDGLLRVGAVVERTGVPVTSSLPRYALARDFAELFLVDGPSLEARAEEWRGRHLTASALSRVELLRRSVVRAAGESRVLVTFPNGEARRMSAGPSSEISRAVIEEFAPRFLDQPGVLWLSESKEKVVARDDDLARSVRLSIETQRILPDIILVDLGPADPLIVFVEVVASAGPVTEKRKEDLLDLVRKGGHDPRNAAFVTAFRDRGATAYRSAAESIAWGSFVWFASEPDRILIYHSRESGATHLSRLLDLGDAWHP